MRRLLVAAPLFLAVGCPNGAPPDHGPVDERVAIPPAPEAGKGVQILLPERVVPTGADQMWCVVSDFAPDQDVLIKSFEAYQGPLGHHLFGMKSAIPRTAGEEFDCTTVDQMTTLEPLISPNTTDKEGNGTLLTDEFTVRIPANTQVIIQSHYVNVSTSDILVRDVVNFVFLPPDEERIEANYLVLNDDALHIPATNEHYVHSSECTMQHDFNFVAMHGHMHEWGKRTFIEHILPDNTTETIYDEPNWNASFRDAPPIERWPTAEPMVFHTGDKMRVTCDWVNDTANDISFPDEMCVSLMVYYPALPEGFVICQ